MPPPLAGPPAAVATGGPKGVGARSPAVWKRVVALTLKPESWAEALRHRLWYTLWAVGLAILLAAITIAVTAGYSALQGARGFAARYDATYPAIKYEGGKLSAGKGGVMRIKGGMGDVVIDVTGKTTLADLGDDPVILVTDVLVIQRLTAMSEAHESVRELAEFFRIKDGEVIDGKYLTSWLGQHGWVVAVVVGGAGFMLSAVQNTVWALMMMLVLGPVVQLAGSGLKMPRRVAYRAAAAVTVPLILLDTGLMVSGVGPAQAMKMDYVPIFWFVAALGLAIWAGVLAGKMYGGRGRDKVTR